MARHQLNLDTGISWVRAHIGIAGNELADRYATYQSFLGRLKQTQPTTTEGGLRTSTEAARAEERAADGYGRGTRTQWQRKALTAYTWFRANRGPQRQWLHKLGKADTGLCDCGQVPIGDHIVWDCPRFRRERNTYIQDRKVWAELDDPTRFRPGGVRRDEAGEDQGGQRFFDFLFTQF